MAKKEKKSKKAKEKKNPYAADCTTNLGKVSAEAAESVEKFAKAKEISEGEAATHLILFAVSRKKSLKKWADANPDAKKSKKPAASKKADKKKSGSKKKKKSKKSSDDVIVVE